MSTGAASAPPPSLVGSSPRGSTHSAARVLPFSISFTSAASRHKAMNPVNRWPAARSVMLAADLNGCQATKGSNGERIYGQNLSDQGLDAEALPPERKQTLLGNKGDGWLMDPKRHRDKGSNSALMETPPKHDSFICWEPGRQHEYVFVRHLLPTHPSYLFTKADMDKTDGKHLLIVEPSGLNGNYKECQKGSNSALKETPPKHLTVSFVGRQHEYVFVRHYQHIQVTYLPKLTWTKLMGNTC